MDENEAQIAKDWFSTQGPLFDIVWHWLIQLKDTYDIWPNYNISRTWIFLKYFCNLDFPEIRENPFPFQNAAFWGAQKTRVNSVAIIWPDDKMTSSNSQALMTQLLSEIDLVQSMSRALAAPTWGSGTNEMEETDRRPCQWDLIHSDFVLQYLLCTGQRIILGRYIKQVWKHDEIRNVI